jgi:hypothetical protein
VGEDDAEVRNGYVVAVDGIAVGPGARGGAWLVVRDDLMTKEIEVDPVLGAAAFGTTQDFSVETTCCFEVVNGKCDVKRAQGHAVMISGRSRRGQREAGLATPVVAHVLAMIKAPVVTVQIGVAEGVTVDGEGAKLGIIAGRVMVGVGTACME